MPQRESVRLMEEYWRAQARIGAGVAARSVAQWARVSPTSLVTSGRAWLTFVMSLVRQERSRSQAAAASFYRLHRAVETGFTLLPLAGGPADETVTLGELRDDWTQYTDTSRDELPDDGATVYVDDFTWPDQDEAAQDTAARTALAITGPARVREGIDRVSSVQQERGRLDSADFLNELQSVMDNAGASSAGAADREAQRGGRSLLRDTSRADTRVIGWARVTDGDPCAWCAMLASRGAVYRSQQVAGIRGRTGRNLPPVNAPEDLEKYHDLCHCQTVPVYSRDAFLPEASAQYARDWRQVTRGLSGAEARRAWRQHIDAQRRTR